MTPTHRSILGLDVGAKRVGVSIASLAARLPRPLTTLNWDDYFYEDLNKIIVREAVSALVIGLPRGLEGQQTTQTYAIHTFTEELREHIELPIHMQDEALTSRQAKEELEARGKSYKKADIDALAATYILQDFLNDNPEVRA